ncbi:SH3 domain-containing protein, partial [Streptococcus suis]
DIAYYDNGSSVNYDKTVVADNYEWISYVSYSGARRYIAINQVAPQPTTGGTSTTPAAPSTAEPTGTISI